MDAVSTYSLHKETPGWQHGSGQDRSSELEEVSLCVALCAVRRPGNDNGKKKNSIHFTTVMVTVVTWTRINIIRGPKRNSSCKRNPRTRTIPRAPPVTHWTIKQMKDPAVRVYKRTIRKSEESGLRSTRPFPCGLAQAKEPPLCTALCLHAVFHYLTHCLLRCRQSQSCQQSMDPEDEQSFFFQVGHGPHSRP